MQDWEFLNACLVSDGPNMSDPLEWEMISMEVSTKIPISLDSFLSLINVGWNVGIV